MYFFFTRAAQTDINQVISSILNHTIQYKTENRASARKDKYMVLWPIIKCFDLLREVQETFFWGRNTSSSSERWGPNNQRNRSGKNILDKGNHLGPVARAKTMRRAGVAGTRTRQGGISWGWATQGHNDSKWRPWRDWCEVEDRTDGTPVRLIFLKHWFQEGTLLKTSVTFTVH